MPSPIRLVAALQALLIVSSIGGVVGALSGCRSLAAAESDSPTLREGERWLDGSFRDNYIRGTQHDLAELGFLMRPFNGVLDDRTRDAISRFQSAARLPITGTLDRSTDKALIALIADLHLVIPSLPPFVFTYLDYNDEPQSCHRADGSCFLIAAQGSFIGDEVDEPSTIRIRCDGEKGTCDYTAVMLGTSGVDLNVNTATFKIARYGRNEVISEPLDGSCGHSVLRLERKSKTVTLTRTRTENDNPACKNSPDLLMRLVDGQDTMKGRLERQLRAFAFLRE